MVLLVKETLVLDHLYSRLNSKTGNRFSISGVVSCMYCISDRQPPLDKLVAAVIGLVKLADMKETSRRRAAETWNDEGVAIYIVLAYTLTCGQVSLKLTSVR